MRVPLAGIAQRVYWKAESSMSRCFISNLTLKNYRCFQKLELSFHPKLTVFVAPNGGGKTAVLDGIVVGSGAFRMKQRGALMSHPTSRKER